MITWKNGNAIINLNNNDGTRIITCEGDLKLEYPLNIDIRVQSRCPLGLNPRTGIARCSFCHESATTDGKECDYEKLKEVLKELPKGIELAIGCNYFSEGFYDFLYWNKEKGFISNITINQLISSSYMTGLYSLMNSGLVNGLGISFRDERHSLIPICSEQIVVHVIAGIDNFKEVKELRERRDVKKILILGEKDFGFNLGKVDLTSQKHKEWYWGVRELFGIFDVVSFDNLALEQLNIKRFITEEKWKELYQYEHSFYINAVEEYFSPSSRSNQRSNYKPIKEYFNEISKK